MPAEQMTKEARDQLLAELDHLRTTERARVAEAIKHARGFGDISENAEYDAAKNDQALLEQRIAKLEERLRRAVIVKKTRSNGKVGFGSKVRFRDLKSKRESEFVIVSEVEADPAAGRLSATSPIGKALMGANKGDEVVAETPRGSKKLRVLRVS